MVVSGEGRGKNYFNSDGSGPGGGGGKIVIIIIIIKLGNFLRMSLMDDPLRSLLRTRGVFEILP